MTHRSAEPAARTADPASSRSTGSILHAGARFEMLIVGHRPGSPPEATLALAALAALCGLSWDGSGMSASWKTEWNQHDHAIGVAALARELGSDRRMVRRGLEFLGARGEAEYLVGVGAVAHPAALAERAGIGCMVRLDRRHRQLGLRAEPLLVLGLLAAREVRGRVVLGIGRIGEALGMPRRTVQRALATLRGCGVIRSKVAPIGQGQLVIYFGGVDHPGVPVDRSGARVVDHPGARVAERDASRAVTASHDAHADQRGAATGPKRRGSVVHPGAGGGPSGRGEWTKEAHAIQDSAGLMQDSDSGEQETAGAVDCPRSETECAPGAEPAPPAPAPTRPPPPPLRPRPVVTVDPGDTPQRRRARLAVAVALKAGRPADAAAAVVGVLGARPTDDALAELLAGVADPAQVRAAMREVRECGPTAQQRHTQDNQPQGES